MFGIGTFKSFGLHAPNPAISSRGVLSALNPQVVAHPQISALSHLHARTAFRGQRRRLRHQRKIKA